MRILILTSRFGFGYGMGYASYKEAAALAALGHSVTVVHCYSDPSIAQYYDPRITVICLPIEKIPLAGFFIYAFKLRKFFREKISIKEFDLVYIQALEFGLMDLEKIRQPIFYFARSTMMGLRNVLRKESVVTSPLEKIIHLILVTLERRCMNYSKIIFVKSNRIASEISSLYGVNLDKLEVITGGIDDIDFHVQSESSRNEFKRKFGIPLNIPVILYAGRIVPQKGLTYLIEASLNLLRDRKFVVIIAGANVSNSYAMKVKRLLSNSIYRKSFYLLGHIDQMDMSLVFNAADCLVTPSLYEPFGMVNLQAAFLGKNIITTDVTGSVEVLANYTKMRIVGPGSSAAIELALKEILIQKPQTNQLPLNLKVYSWRSVAEQLLQFFSSVTTQVPKIQPRN